MNRPSRRVLAAGVLVLTTTTGCSAADLAAWVAWHDQDPVAATEFARHPDVETALADAIAAFEEVLESRYGVAVWDDIAGCESGGDWDHPPVTNRTGTYSGGLMIGHRWWPAYDGDQFASAPFQATKAEQIVIAERIADDAGLDAAWQCWP